MNFFFHKLFLTDFIRKKE